MLWICLLLIAATRANVWVAHPCTDDSQCQIYLIGEGCDRGYCGCPGTATYCNQVDRFCKYEIDYSRFCHATPTVDGGSNCYRNRCHGGRCINYFLDAGEACRDGDYCTTLDKCVDTETLGRVCRGTYVERICDDSDESTLDQCITNYFDTSCAYTPVADLPPATPPGSAPVGGVPITPAREQALSAAPVVTMAVPRGRDPGVRMSFAGLRAGGQAAPATLRTDRWVLNASEGSGYSTQAYTASGGRAAVNFTTVRDSAPVEVPGLWAAAGSQRMYATVEATPKRTGSGDDVAALFCVEALRPPSAMVVTGPSTALLQLTAEWAAELEASPELICAGERLPANVTFHFNDTATAEACAARQTALIIVSGRCANGSVAFDPSLRPLLAGSLDVDGSDAAGLGGVAMMSAIGLGAAALVVAGAGVFVFARARASRQRRATRQIAESARLSTMRDALADGRGGSTASHRSFGAEDPGADMFAAGAESRAALDELRPGSGSIARGALGP